jgi:hypothetical protein
VKLSAIILARVLAFVEVYDLAPRGGVFYPDLVRDLVQHYHFQKFPQSAEQVDEHKGIEFYSGKSGNWTIDKFVIFDSLLVLETRAGTTESKQIIEEMLLWGKDKFGLKYQPGMIRRFGYVSNLTFHTDVPILGEPNSPLAKLALKTGSEVSKIWGETINYEPTLVSASLDPLTRKNPIAALSITRRAEHPFSEHKYYSESPLPTDLHLSLLEQYEADVRANLTRG